MTEGSINIDDILGDADDTVQLENIDADAILGDDDDYICLTNNENNTILPDNVTKNSPTVNEISEEQLDYEEDETTVSAKPTSSIVIQEDIIPQQAKDEKKEPETVDKNQKEQNKNDENSKSNKYYINPDFKGPFPPNFPNGRGSMYMHNYHPSGVMPPLYRGFPPIPPYMHSAIRPPFPTLNMRPMIGLGPQSGPAIAGPMLPLPGHLIRPSFPSRYMHLPERHRNKVRRENQGKENLAKFNQSSKLQKNENNKTEENKKNETNISNQGNKLTQGASKKKKFQRKNQKQSNAAKNASAILNTLPTVRIGLPAAGSSSSSTSFTSLVPPTANIDAIVNASLKNASLSSNQPISQTSNVNILPTVVIRPNLNPPVIGTNFQTNVLPNSMQRNMFSGGFYNFGQSLGSLTSGANSMSSCLGSGLMNSMPKVTSEGLNWSLMVDAFVRKTSDRKPLLATAFRRSPTRSPTYTSRTRSRSYSHSSVSRSFSLSASPEGDNILIGSRSRSPKSPTTEHGQHSSLLQKRRYHRHDRNYNRQHKGNDKHAHKNNIKGKYYNRRNLSPRSRRAIDDLKTEEESKEDLKHTIECAVAIGLDEEYLKKIAEQKRLREELAKRRSQKRQENYLTNETDIKMRRGVKPPSPDDTTRRKRTDKSKERNLTDRSRSRHLKTRLSPTRIETNDKFKIDRRDKDRRQSDSPVKHRKIVSSERNGRSLNRQVNELERKSRIDEENKSKTATDQTKKIIANANVIVKTETSAQAVGTGKQKAYLAVVVSNVKELENSYKRVSLLANAIGTTKKVWQTSENTISIIFTKLEHAKQFMLQYHGKIVNGCRLDVSLEKVFLNLSTMP